jgi:cephalosporin-C deacetylase-like acetyl esterase
MVRWTDFLCSLPEWDGKNLAVQGGSQGGALALVTAALDKRVTACCVNHPALTDMAGYAEKGRTGGYPHFKTEQLTPQVIDVLSYYDVINFCRLVKCPVRMTWGYNDNTCPPTTSYAAWNTLSCPKECVLTPINEHWTSEQTEYEHMLWIKGKIIK